MLVDILATAAGLFLVAVLGWFIVVQVAIRRDAHPSGVAPRPWLDHSALSESAGIDHEAFDAS